MFPFQFQFVFHNSAVPDLPLPSSSSPSPSSSSDDDPDDSITFARDKNKGLSDEVRQRAYAKAWLKEFSEQTGPNRQVLGNTPNEWDVFNSIFTDDIFEVSLIFLLP